MNRKSFRKSFRRKPSSEDKKKKRGTMRFSKKATNEISVQLERDRMIEKQKSLKKGYVPPDAFIGAVDGNGGSFSPALVRQALICFYAKHDPEKDDLNELFDVLLYYASKRGISPLNMKLKRKYGESLDDTDLPDYGPDYDTDEAPPPPMDDDEPPPPEDEEPPPPPPDDEEIATKKASRRKSIWAGLRRASKANR
mmetsp:Transcript_7036/g.15633  ORF Transcript_7036/g.15633 Transcript_7036/m.15633 type:complete len:196 (-) Transcript_7036:57-644(-)